MRYHLSLAAFSALLPAFVAAQAQVIPLKVIADCDSNPRCEIIDDHPLLINVLVTNQNDEDIECTFTYVEKMGPSTTLVDKITGRSIKLPVSQPPRLADVSLTKLRAGDVWKTYVVVYPGEIRALGQGITGFDARIAVRVDGQSSETGKLASCEGEAILSIGHTLK